MTQNRTPVALTIAGSDPSGGAGIQADLKTFHQFGVYGEAVITLLTVQNTTRVSRVEILAPDLVQQQIEAVLEDIPPHAAKTGALGNRDLIEMIASLAKNWAFPLIVDPVMISKHGAPLMSSDASAALAKRLIPVTALITPNLPEAEALTGRIVQTVDGMRDAARALYSMGARAVLLKGGHLADQATDILYDGEWLELPAPHVATRHTHGTGCTYASAITALLAQGYPLRESVRRAKQFIQDAIASAPGLGAGSGPVNHFARFGVPVS